jgi:AcrR family transcriptional regulator
LKQNERTQQSQALVLASALKLFSSQGYRGTSIRDIAVAAGVSTGNVYHHFSDKETIFRMLLDEYWKAIESPDFPFNRALASGAFPDDLEELGRAARESVVRYRPYIALIYVDVVEFDGTHIRRFYAHMARRFARFLKSHGSRLALEKKLRPGVSPLSAVMLATRIFLNHFAVEIVFGVPNHFGKKNEDAVKEIAEILRHGLLPEAAEMTGEKTARAEKTRLRSA